MKTYRDEGGNMWLCDRKIFSQQKQHVQRPWGRILPGVFQEHQEGWVAGVH